MKGETDEEKKKAHRPRNAGRKAEKKKKRQEGDLIERAQAAKQNPKAFAVKSAVKAERLFRRTQDLIVKKQHIPEVDRTPTEPPPIVVAIVGPPKVGKTTLLRCLIKNFTRQRMNQINGPVTVVIGKKRRVTFLECNNDINCMIDIAKVADLVLLLVDAWFGFEMETFEFLNICQVHGFPRIMGVLTHLDYFKNNKQLRKTKKTLKHRFWTEIYPGAKLFYLSGMVHSEYQKTEVKNLGRFISVMKFRPLQWRTSHPYVVVDRVEDLTSMEVVRQNSKANRYAALYGYVRGIHLKPDTSLHIPGTRKKRSLNEKERIIYAPMSGVGGLLYDKDAVYVDVKESTSMQESQVVGKEGEASSPEWRKTSGLMGLGSLISGDLTPLDQRLQESQVRLFSSAEPIKAADFQCDVEVIEEGDGRKRRRVVFPSASEEIPEGNERDDDASASEEENKNDSDGEAELQEGIEDDEEGNEEEDSDVEEEEAEAEEDEEEAEEDEEEAEAEEDEEEAEEDEEEAEAKEDEEEAEAKEDEEEEEGEMEESCLKWKVNLREKAAHAFYQQLASPSNLKRLVYGSGVKGRESVGVETSEREDPGSMESEDEDNLGGLFKITKKKAIGKFQSPDSNPQDSALFFVDHLQDWSQSSVKEEIQDCFVTGKWERGKDAQTLLAMDVDGDDDQEVFGDFEDLETGKTYQGENKEHEEGIETGEEQRLEKKKEMKDMFDAEYDDKTHSSESYYDEWRKQLDYQAQLNRSEFEGLDENLRCQYEGYRPGMYVRVELRNVPSEFFLHFHPSYPIILGGLLLGEENLTCVQVYLFPSFSRTILDLDRSVEVVKKLKIVGTPMTIHKKTAFVRGMFTTPLEAAKFEGASVKTASGIRGCIKKALTSGKHPGVVRCTFEDRILLSDVVFLRTWYPIQLPKLYAPMKTLLLPMLERMQWQGMKTVGQLKREQGIRALPNPDQLYTPVEREWKEFRPLQIPKSLQKNLPYKDKRKLPGKKRKVPSDEQRLTIIPEPHEQKV
ncbi:unnamed protein product [Darwinula stevensoni]|uniref:Bms1-type G domain-containing protein n=1 Tax=Darwinula stevensoni TaxID=69355 RepID=A0A7R9A278_9CRUS|nr:unnamed protein product [Darwinula stevensoni]CAG0879328.1 unnamed protein product [Darwinula stevensoni]